MVAFLVFALLGVVGLFAAQDPGFPYLFAIAVVWFCLGLLAESWPAPGVRNTPHGGKLP